MPTRVQRLATLTFSLVFVACGDPEGPLSDATADLAGARAAIAAGRVPTADQLSTRAAWSELDVRVDGPPCNSVLCARAIATTAGDSLWLHAGLVTGVDLASFHRESLNAVLVIDNSGSMGLEKMDAVKRAAGRLIDQLGPDDLLSVVRFDTFSAVLQNPKPVSDRAAVKALLQGVKATGSTCLECGLRDALKAAASTGSLSRANRVFILTDGLPAGDGSEFVSLLEAAAEQETYVSLLTVGLSYPEPLAQRLLRVHGLWAAFGLTPDQLALAFGSRFELEVTPIAFDLSADFTPSSGLAAFDVSGEPAPTNRATVFLDRAPDVQLLRLTGAVDQATAGTVTLKYTVKPSVNLWSLGIRAQATLESTQTISQSTAGPATRRVVAVTRAMSALQSASTAWYAARKDDARAAARASVDVLAATGDPALDADLALARGVETLVGR